MYNISEIKNNILQKRIEYWLNKMPISKCLLEHEAVFGFLVAMDETTNFREINSKILNDFVDGLVFVSYAIIKNDLESSDFIEHLVRPGLNFIESYIRSEYQNNLIDNEVTGEEILIIHDIKIPISQKQIKQHIKRTKKLPLTTSDIANITADFIEYKRMMYTPKSLHIPQIIYTPHFCPEMKPINFCEQTVFYEGEFDAFQIPYDIIEPKSGNHDYNLCESCKKYWQDINIHLCGYYNGNGQGKNPFPFCCERHKNLVNLNYFDKKDFDDSPNLTAKKIIFTKEQILNCIETVDWYKDITDYIEYTIDSFGKVPAKCGHPLFLNSYCEEISRFLNDRKDLSKKKIQKIRKYLQPPKRDNDKDKITDFNILIETYEKWYKIFPFGLNDYFGSLKEYYKTHFPIFSGKVEINQYTQHAKISSHTKDSLIEYLMKLTSTLIMQINGAVLYDKGLITNIGKVRIDLLTQERLLKIKDGYVNSSPNEEQQYRNILKVWFKDEKEYFDTLSKILKEEGVQMIVNEDKKYIVSVQVNENFLREFSSTNIPFKTIFEKNNLLKNELFEEFKLAPSKPSFSLYSRQYYTDEEYVIGIKEANDRLPKMSSSTDNIPLVASTVSLTPFEIHIQDLYNNFIKEISKGILSKDLFCNDIEAIPTIIILKKVDNTFDLLLKSTLNKEIENTAIRAESILQSINELSSEYLKSIILHHLVNENTNIYLIIDKYYPNEANDRWKAIKDEFNTIIRRFINTQEDSNIPPIKENCESKTILDSIVQSENLFWKGLPMNKVVDHFNKLAVRKSKNGKTFLTEGQLISFFKKGFLGDETQLKQKINFISGEKGFVISLFYDFYTLAVDNYNHIQNKNKFIDLFCNSFEGFTESSVSAFFKPNKTKNKW